MDGCRARSEPTAIVSSRLVSDSESCLLPSAFRNFEREREREIKANLRANTGSIFEVLYMGFGVAWISREEEGEWGLFASDCRVLRSALIGAECDDSVS